MVTAVKQNAAPTLVQVSKERLFQYRLNASYNPYCHNPTGNTMLKSSPSINLSVQ